MKKILSMVLGFEWIQNIGAKKVARAAAAGLFVLAGKWAWLALGLSAFGLTPEAVSSGLVVIALAALEALRGWSKHSDQPK